MFQQPLYGIASVLVLGVAAQWVAARIRIPSILLLLLTGLLAGPVLRSFHPGWSLEPDRLLGPVLLPLVSLSVGLILYEGGLTLRFKDLGRDAAVVWKLVTIGVLVTAVIISLAAWALLDLPLPMCILLGALLTVSGPTVVAPLLAHFRPVGRVGPILRWEGTVIDPIGATLAALVFEFIHASGQPGGAGWPVLDAARSAVLGSLLGASAGFGLAALLRRYLIPDALQNPVSVMSVVGIFALSNVFGRESGLFAATAMGIVLGNQQSADIHHIVEFKENLRTLLLAFLFILLAARLQAGDILAVLGPRALAFLALIILVIRPLAVAASTVGAGLAPGERLFLAWMCPRGVVAAAISSVFALELDAQGVPGADRLSAAVFFVIIGTVLVYGFSSPPLARRLGLADPDPQGLLVAGAHPWAREIARILSDRGFRTILIDTNRENTSASRLQGLEAHPRNIQDPTIAQQIDLTGIGRLLAITSNDEVNDLAAHRFARHFGRASVYRLAPRTAPKDPAAAEASPGRRLWASDATFARLQAVWDQGAAIKVTPLTDAFGLDQFAAAHPDAIPLFFLPAAGKLSILTPERAAEERTGHLVSMAPSIPAGVAVVASTADSAAAP